MNIAPMLNLSMKEFAGRSKFLTGATVGGEHRLRIAELVRENAESDQMVIVLNFDGIESVTASYFKATVLALARTQLQCGAFSDLSIFPVTYNLSEDLRVELAIVCQSEKFPCLEVTGLAQKQLTKGRLHGKIDVSLARALQLLQSFSPGTAASLAEHSPQENVNLTAWNNRVAELFRLRLVTRFKEGRFWKYQPVIKEINYGI